MRSARQLAEHLALLDDQPNLVYSVDADGAVPAELGGPIEVDPDESGVPVKLVDQTAFEPEPGGSRVADQDQSVWESTHPKI